MYIEKKLYSDILANMPIPTVDLLFLNSQNQLLLAKRNNEPLLGIYYIPGGRIVKSETTRNAAKRKAREELGIDIDVDRLEFVGVYDDIFENSAFEGVSTHCIPTTYLYRLSPGEEKGLVIGDAQHSDFRFFSLSDPSLHELVKLRIDDLNTLL